LSKRITDPFAPVPLQYLHHYYCVIRPCALHRYANSYRFLVSLLVFHTKVCVKFMSSSQLKLV
ncbi:MAG: hypothetical protein ACI8VW_003126, partial [bacterium]